MSDWKNNPEWVAAARTLCDCIKMMHKQVDCVGHKSEIGRALLEKESQLRIEFAEKWGAETLVAAVFIAQKKSSNHKTVINKRSREDY